MNGLIEGGQLTGGSPVVADFRIATAFGDGDLNRIFMDIESDVKHGI
jgi:hypothetical protein